MRKKGRENNKGITLIALVITIIILLILAGASIAMITGDNGLITKANEAKQETEKEEVRELVQLEVAASFNNDGIYNPNLAINNLKNSLDITVTKNENNTLQLNYKGYNMLVTDKGIVKLLEEISNIETNHIPVILNYTWEELNKIATVISNNDSIINNRTAEVTVAIDEKNYTIGIGDTTTVNYNGTPKQVRIIGFNHDKLEDTTDYEGNSTYAGISFEFIDVIETTQMNNINSNLGGWNECKLRNTLNNENSGTITNLSNKTYIKKVKKDYIEIYNDASSVKQVSDYLWLLSCSEIWNNGRNDINHSYGYAITKEGEQYKYYLDINADADSNTDALIKNKIGWWLRSPFRDFRDGFCFVSKDGISSCIAANSTAIGVIPSFSI